MAVPVIGKVMRKVFGSHNERMVKRYLTIVDEVSSHEAETRLLTDDELRAKTEMFRQRVADGAKPTDLIPEVFAVAREAMDRAVGIRNIFNPEESFDPARLPDAARRLYDEVKAEIDRTEDRPPLDELLGCTEMVPAWRFVSIPPALYEAVRALYPESRPPFRARPFDVQIIGGMVLYEGRIAEMKTGEGKTIVAPLATYLAAIERQQVHVVTVNEYLVQRDRDWTYPFYHALGLTVGAIHPQHMQAPQMKYAAYQCDVVYGTTSEFGFDYLRDNMKTSLAEQFQRNRDFAIVDEVDSVLIDEARTPLIISGLAHEYRPRYELADRLARHLVQIQEAWDAADQRVQSCLVDIAGLEGDIRNARDKTMVPAMKAELEAKRKQLAPLEAERDRYTQFYEVELDKKKASLTHEGIAAAQKEAGVGSFYVGDNIDLPHLLENAIRAHTVYQRDRDYVVQNDENGQMGVIIVDQNTGRKMIGRQWSDGLHQSVEAKEGVPIKQETQTMATVTIQDFYKMYDKVAGMTGTADTEATEYCEIYRLDVVVIPTNVPVVRNDRNDFVFLSQKDKWDAIVDEVKTFHDCGRPVLVGTTSVERSEMLSEMLTKKHSIRHEVLNAKQHDREADIIVKAGTLGAVMIATNMAGRGTDIKLGPCEPAVLIDHWKRRGICPRHVTPDMPEDDIVAACYRHLVASVDGVTKKDAEAMSDAEIRRRLLEDWAAIHTSLAPKKIASLSDDQLRDELDQSGSSLLHRLRLFPNTEAMGGLHVIGTERHESRRIDNQLRGRSGRQGDRGSSRFFLSLEDDLMKMFAGEKTLSLLSKLGMKEGDVIEHPMLSRAVEKAQRKVEERNFLIRKNILEYDEVMDHQRSIFYGRRQDVLEGTNVKETIFNEIDVAVEDATSTYLDPHYVSTCIAEWVREHLNVVIEAERFTGKDREDLANMVAVNAKEEAGSVIRVTMGEYAPSDTDPSEWDLRGLSEWANSNFKAGLKLSELSGMSAVQMIRRIEEAAERMIDAVDLAPLDQFLVPNYGARELVGWAKKKFDGEFKVEDFAELDSPMDAAELIKDKARAAYRRRELTFPVEYAMDATTAMFQQHPDGALRQLCDWVRSRFELEWSPTALPSTNPNELRERLIAEAETWDDARIRARAEKAVAAASTPADLDEWFQKNMRVRLSPAEYERAETDLREVAQTKIRNAMRAELTQFERWILLQIYDRAWKDHLHAMDQVKETIGLRSFSQKDPRIEFKREGARLFDEMQESIRDRVTDLVFRGKLVANVQPQARPAPTDAPEPDAAP
ncbi:MAG: preprotein translocase subunit SecA, partial [Phycisphaerales bacterium]|nr:preprotein translocase subunit SecA [Phycisphaerales bacterium]